MEFIQPGKPTQNPVIESFNGKMRDEVLILHRWRTVAEARAAIAVHRIDYNQVRPHGSLDERTPQEFVAALRGSDSGTRVA